MKKLGILLIGALLLTGCSSSSTENTIKVGASITPHAQILGVVKDQLAEQGYTLEVVEYTDYVIPNQALQSGELDANYFQHKPYLDTFNLEHKTDLVDVATVHYEPFGIYSENLTDLDELPENAEVLVPNDGTNEARALLLLEKAGIITLDPAAGINATVRDITSKPEGLKIIEVEAAQLTKSLKDVDLAVINGNYALQDGLSVKNDALLIEDEASFGAKTYGNVIAVKVGQEDSAKTKALVEALRSDAVKEFIDTTYDGAVIFLS